MSAIKKVFEELSGSGMDEEIAAAQMELAALALHSLEWQTERNRLRQEVSERDRRDAELREAFEGWQADDSPSYAEALIEAFERWDAKGATHG